MVDREGAESSEEAVPEAGRPDGAAPPSPPRKRQPRKKGRPREGVSLIAEGDLVMGLAKNLMHMLHDLPKMTGQPVITKKQLARAIDLELGQVNGIMNPGAQKKRTLSLDVIRKMTLYARKTAESTKETHLKHALIDIGNSIIRETQKLLQTDELTATEDALVSQLNIVSDDQKAFESAYAGVHAVIRFTANGDLAVSRMNIHPRAAGGGVCRFETSRLVGPMDEEPAVNGYIYSADHYVYAIGRTATVGALRSTVLWPVPRRDGTSNVDLIGLRLSNTGLDREPFCHRVYCRKIADTDKLGDPFAAWGGTFDTHAYDSTTHLKLLDRITDIQAIINLLRQEEDKPMAWGLRLPKGQRPTPAKR